MENLIGSILFGGVLLSTAALCTGLIWRLVQSGHLSIEYSLGAHSLAGFWAQVIHGLMGLELRPRLLINLGLALLLMTPYVRVLVSFLFFVFVERNGKYSVFTFFVLSVLTYTLFAH